MESPPDDDAGPEDQDRPGPPKQYARDEGYEVDVDGEPKFVIFDSKNPLAWIISDWYGTPPDLDEPEAERREE